MFRGNSQRIRQIIGWREFIRGVYVCKGTEERNKNFWKFSRKIPSSFYSATTGIDPVDDTINKINKSGYANHIERLMIIGNSEKGEQTTDHYSMMGFTKAYNAAKKSCSQLII